MVLLPRRPVLATGLVALSVACGRSDGPPAAETRTATSARTAIDGASAAPSAGSAPADPSADPDDVPEPPPASPTVDLAGRHTPRPTLPGKLLYARDLRAWVHLRPTSSSRRLGYLRAGAGVAVRGPVAGHDGCRQGWVPVAPRGYVCLGRDATLDGDAPVVRALHPYPPRFDRKLPYIYGTVRRPGPVYQRLPSKAEVTKAEKGHESRMKEWLELEGEHGASYAQHVWEGQTDPKLVAVRSPVTAWEAGTSDPLPWFLQEGRVVPNLRHYKDWDGKALVRRRMRPKVGHSIVTALFHEGRRYAVASDLLILPTDRLRPIQGSKHVGFRVGEEVELPFAIVRKKFARYTTIEDGKVKRGKKAAYFSAVPLTGKRRFLRINYRGKSRRILHYETKDGRWIADRYASRVEGVKRPPKWAKRGERWLDVALGRQLLRAYEGTKLVYATLISSGEAGLEDPEHTTATKRGIFRIHTKHVTATMSSDEVGEAFELRDVPYVQYFDKAGYAIHGAYWHDRFGTPKSHGCINLTPEDARRLFFWTSPDMPAGWHGRLKPRTGTVVFIHP